MTSYIAIFLLAILIVGSIAFLIAGYVGRGRDGKRLAIASPALFALFPVFAVYVVGWMLSVLLARR